MRTPTHLSLCLAFLAACPTVSKDDMQNRIDADQDGYYSDDLSDGDDCDDLNNSIHPGADEIWYDGTDQDCSGGSDFDKDGDGADSAEHLEGGADCNDEDDAIYPGATEIWYDDIDQDCVGDSDFDQDHDGFESALEAEDGLDCDDLEASINPAALSDVSYDGIDQNCDGVYFEDRVSQLTDSLSVSGTGQTCIYGTEGKSTKPNLGWRSVALGDLNADGEMDFGFTDRLECRNQSAQGALYVVAGPLQSHLVEDDPDLDPHTVHIEESEVAAVRWGLNVFAGYSLAGAGDFDGDGHDDLLVSDYALEAVYLITDGLDTSKSEMYQAKYLFSNFDSAADNRAGISVVGGSDLDGDGAPDVAVGASAGGTGGEVAIFLHAETQEGTNSFATHAAAVIGTNISNANAGISLASAGDINGDGRDDLLVGATDVGSGFAGVYLLESPTDWSTYDAGTFGSAAAAIFQSTKANAGDLAGVILTDAADLNADGTPDILVPAYQDSYAPESLGFSGSVYGYFGGSLSGTYRLELDPGSGGSDLHIYGTAGSRLGSDASASGDLNGDGFNDLVVGAYQRSDYAVTGGAVHAFFGPLDAMATPLSAATAPGTWHGDTEGGYFGETLSYAGDVNGDGKDDVFSSGRLDIVTVLMGTDP